MADFESDQPLKQKSVEKIFDDVQKLDKIVMDLKGGSIFFDPNDYQMTGFQKYYDPGDGH